MSRVSRQEAVNGGLKRYYTGEPCKYGHLSERYTVDSQCIECKRQGKRKTYQNKLATWTAKMMERLPEMAKTMSSSEIGDVFGVSRNSVIGKCHRVGVQLTARTGPRPDQRRTGVGSYKPRKVAPTVRLVVVKFEPLLPRPAHPPAPSSTEGRRGAGPAVLALKGDQCCFPFGEPSDDTFYFCSAYVDDPVLVPRYCPDHWTLAINPLHRKARR